MKQAGTLAVGLIGDFDPAVVAHRAIPIALAGAAHKLGALVEAFSVCGAEVPLAGALLRAAAAATAD